MVMVMWVGEEAELNWKHWHILLQIYGSSSEKIDRKKEYNFKFYSPKRRIKKLFSKDNNHNAGTEHVSEWDGELKGILIKFTEIFTACGSKNLNVIWNLKFPNWTENIENWFYVIYWLIKRDEYSKLREAERYRTDGFRSTNKIAFLKESRVIIFHSPLMLSL